MMSVSVIIPAYNAGRFIKAAVASVLSQDTAPDEIVVVNDGSTDYDYANLEGLHQSIRVIEQPNRGVSAARNLGCELATSEYIAILDADDVWLPGKLAAQMRHLVRHPEVDATFCHGVPWMPGDTPSEWIIPAEFRKAPESEPEVVHLHFSDFLCGIPVAPSTMVIKKSVWRELNGFNEELRYGEDHDFYHRLSYSRKTDLLIMMGMLYRRHPNSATYKLSRQNHWADVIGRTLESLGTVDIFGHRVDARKLAKHLAYIHFQHGYAHFWADDFETARHEFFLAVKQAPLHRRAMAYLAISSIPGFRKLIRRSLRPASRT